MLPTELGPHLVVLHGNKISHDFGFKNHNITSKVIPALINYPLLNSKMKLFIREIFTYKYEIERMISNWNVNHLICITDIHILIKVETNSVLPIDSFFEGSLEQFIEFILFFFVREPFKCTI